MNRFRSLGGAVVLATLLLAGCGGGGDGDQSPRVQYSQLVTFGDSLSDVGSYRVGAIVALGGGEFTINSNNGVGINWTERVAAQGGLGSLCPAQTGLESTIPSIPAVPIAFHAECTSYAMGGARVTNPVGVGNKRVPPGTAPSLGQLTVPVVTQMQNHLAKIGGSFTGKELVTVLAGGNDAIINTAFIGAGVQTPTGAVTAMATAGGELAAYVKTLLIANGAKHVVVLTLPDLSQTPFAYAFSADTQALINKMVTTFNEQLVTGLSGVSGVLIVDTYTQSRDQVANPAQYSLVNVTDMACDFTKTPLPTSLVCTPQTLIAGDTSHYEFADQVHPTPFAYELLARFVLAQMAKAGWF